MKRIYLDYAATTPVDPRVLRAMWPYFSEKFGNPGSVHRAGQEAIAAIDEAREKISKSIGAQFREIIFTASATEANNLAMRGAARLFSTGSGRFFAPAAKNSLDSRTSAEPSPRRSETFRTKTTEPLRFIVSGVEHESILETARALEKEGVEVIYLPVNREGLIDLKKLKAALNERTVLVSIMYANNEVGTVQPIKEIAQIISNFKKTLVASGYPLYPIFHTDAAQAFQYFDCDVNFLGVDMMTLSSHKIYGPKGVGALYIKRQGLATSHYPLATIITGGGQEYGLRSGTENVPAIVGFGAAAELLVNYDSEASRVAELRDYFWRKLSARGGSSSGGKKFKPKIQINGPVLGKLRDKEGILSLRLPNNLNIYFPDSSSEKLLVKLDMLGVEASAGSACAARSLVASYVLKAMGMSDKRASSSVRFSLGRQTDKNNIDELLARIKNI